MSSLGLDLSRNISFFTVPAAFVATLGPHIYAIVAAGKTFDNANPRAIKDSVGTCQTLDNESKQRILRAKSASENGFETIGLYAAAVVAANQAKLHPRTLNLLTLTYVASRFAFLFTYVVLQKDNNQTVAGMRSLFWQVGMITTMTLFIKAGLNMTEYVF